MDHLTAVKIELLDGAYRRVAAFNPNDLHMGICHALDCEACQRQKMESTPDDIGMSFAAVKELYDYIARAIRPDIFYYAWLMHNHAIPGGLEAAKRGRLAWIDAMIAALREGRPLPEKPSLPSDYKPRPSSAPEQNFYHI